jgi:hypothetical protein
MEKGDKANYKNVSKFAFPPSNLRTTKNKQKHCYICTHFGTLFGRFRVLFTTFI